MAVVDAWLLVPVVGQNGKVHPFANVLDAYLQ